MQKVINYFGVLLKPRKMDDLFEKLKAEPPTVPFKAGERRGPPPVLNSSPSDETPTFSKNRMSPSDSKPMQEDSRQSPAKVETTTEDSNANLEESVSEEKKQMPTKAQQKLFEPVPDAPLAKAQQKLLEPVSDAPLDKAQQKLLEPVPDAPLDKARKVKSCKVRVKREDLESLSKKFANETAQKKDNSVTTTSTIDRKRKIVNESSSPPEKKTRKSKESSPKKGAGFFIKLNKSLPVVRKPTTNRKRSESQSPTVLQKDRPRRVNNQQAMTSSSNFTTKATKFTRTQLIRDFGKRCFNLTVRMKRCKHPVLVAFDSNVRAQLQQCRKSKNLSVSFKEQVEIIDDTDSESIYSEENNLDSKGATPARLKKVENGKLVDNELDPSQFIGEDVENNSSTPLRKKTEKKSYSPLKDDSSSSARSEQLKLANEKLPPCGLRRLRDTASDDDDDDDEEAEYIVPTDIPEKLSSRPNSLNNTIDSNNATKGSDVVSAPTTTDATERKSKKKSLSTSLLSDSPTTEKESSISENKRNEENSRKSLDDGSSQPLPKSNAEAPASDKKSSVKHVNGKRTGALTEESVSHSEKDANSKNDKLNEDENKTINLILEDELFTPDSQDNTSESLVKKVIDILTEDIDLPEIKKSEEIELPATVKAIATEIKTSSNNI